MSICARFTLLYTLILALTLTIFGVALYTVQAQDTLNSLKKDLVISANRFADATQKTETRPIPPPDEVKFQPIPFDQFSKEKEFQVFSERELVRVLDMNGGKSLPFLKNACSYIVGAFLLMELLPILCRSPGH